MNELNTDIYPNDHEIDLKHLFYILLEQKWIIFSVTTFVSIIAVIYSLLLPNIYESKTLLVPANSSNSISSSMGAYSDLIGFSGLGLSGDNVMSNSDKAKKKIESLSFFTNNILTNIYLPDLMAVESWDPKTNSVVYDNNIYDTNSNSWIRAYSYPKHQIPSQQESFKVFKSKHLSFNSDLKSGFSVLSIKHQSPFVAKQWSELIVNEINNFYRQKDKLQAEKAVNYLNQQVLTTSLSEIKQVLAQLLQEETKKLTLVEANQFYVFDYIDPPVVMEKKSAPNRLLICILGLLLGGILSIMYVLIRHFLFSNKI
jgi:hypothetical protein